MKYDVTTQNTNQPKLLISYTQKILKLHVGISNLPTIYQYICQHECITAGSSFINNPRCIFCTKVLVFLSTIDQFIILRKDIGPRTL